MKKLKNELDAAPSTSIRKRRWDDSDGNPNPIVSTLPAGQNIPAASSAPSSLTTINPESEFEKAKALIRAKAAALMGGAPLIDTEEERKRAKAIEEQKMVFLFYI